MSQVGNNLGQKTETDGKRRFRPGETASDEQQYERYMMIGDYENPVQTMPSGEGNFYFESNNPGRIDSFYAPNADLLLRQIYSKYSGRADANDFVLRMMEDVFRKSESFHDLFAFLR